MRISVLCCEVVKLENWGLWTMQVDSYVSMEAPQQWFKTNYHSDPFSIFWTHTHTHIFVASETIPFRFDFWPIRIMDHIGFPKKLSHFISLADELAFPWLFWVFIGWLWPTVGHIHGAKTVEAPAGFALDSKLWQEGKVATPIHNWPLKHWEVQRLRLSWWLIYSWFLIHSYHLLI